MEAKEVRSQVESLIKLARIPANRVGKSALCGIRDYRGKRQWVVGYSWHRPGAHHANGLVYDAILGWGESPELALKKALGRLTAG